MTTGRVITSRIGRYSEQDDESHCYTATVDGIEVSTLWISLDTRMIVQVETLPAYRRQGHASALYDAAVRDLGTVYHSPEQWRTPEGNGWAGSVGGDVAEVEDDSEDWRSEEQW